MTARKGTGRIHAKWSPVATCIMWREPIVRIDEDLLNEGLIVIEVDDMLEGGGPRHEAIMEAIAKDLKFGKAEP